VLDFFIKHLRVIFFIVDFIKKKDEADGDRRRGGQPAGCFGGYG
jgi:hypothetical protein